MYKTVLRNHHRTREALGVCCPQICGFEPQIWSNLCPFFFFFFCGFEGLNSLSLSVSCGFEGQLEPIWRKSGTSIVQSCWDNLILLNRLLNVYFSMLSTESGRRSRRNRKGKFLPFFGNHVKTSLRPDFGNFADTKYSRHPHNPYLCGGRSRVWVIRGYGLVEVTYNQVENLILG